MTSTIHLQRWHDILLAISKGRERYRYAERLYKKLGCSRTYFREVISQLLAEDLIEIIPEKKIKRLVLTDKGRRVTQSLQTLNSELSEYERQDLYA